MSTKMSANQAVNILDAAGSQYRGTRKEHQNIETAVITLANFIKSTATKTIKAEEKTQKKSNNPIKEIIIYNNLGMKLVEKVLVNKSIDISELASGLHFIEINDFSGNKVTRKLIKE